MGFHLRRKRKQAQKQVEIIEPYIGEISEQADQKQANFSIVDILTGKTDFYENEKQVFEDLLNQEIGEVINESIPEQIIPPEIEEEIPEEIINESIPEEKIPAANHPVTYKILIMGEGGVGKTTLFKKYDEDKFIVDTKLTVGVGIHAHKLENVEAYNGELFDANLSIWDIGGQERFEFLRDSFYKGASGGLLLFDVTSYMSYDALDKWIGEFSEYAATNLDIVYPVILVASKMDLVQSGEYERAVPYDEAKALADEHGFGYIETSAKTGLNVDEAFELLTEYMINETLKIESANMKKMEKEA